MRRSLLRWGCRWRSPAFDGVFEVDGGAVEVGCAHLIDDDLYAVEVADCVAVEDALVEVELVDETEQPPGWTAMRRRRSRCGLPVRGVRGPWPVRLR